MKVLLCVNSGHVRHPPHDGHFCTDMYLPVTLKDNPPVEHNGRKLRTVKDAALRSHLVDEWFIRDAETLEQVFPDGK